MRLSIIREPRCRCCTSKYRLLIEQQLVAGWNFAAIARQVPPNIGGRRVERRSVANHYRRHLGPILRRTEAQIESDALMERTLQAMLKSS
jgi:hypothetical protein